MINTKQDLRFYIKADRIMNGLNENKTLKEFVLNLIDRPAGGVIINYLRAMRYFAYYKNTVHSMFSLKAIMMIYWHRRWNRLGLKLGFSFAANSLGYGVVIPHNGTIIISQDARVGNFAVLHTCTCITGGEKVIGDYFYLASGSQLVGKLCIGDGVSVAAHSLVNTSSDGHCLLAGAPAVVKKINYPLWVDRDGNQYVSRVNKVLKLRESMCGITE